MMIIAIISIRGVDKAELLLKLWERQAPNRFSGSTDNPTRELAMEEYVRNGGHIRYF